MAQLAEDKKEGRHKDDPATDTQKPGKHSRKRAHSQKHRRHGDEGRQIVHGLSYAASRVT